MVKLAICTSLDPTSCSSRANAARSAASARLFSSDLDMLVSLKYFFTNSGLISPDFWFKSSERRFDRPSAAPARAAGEVEKIYLTHVVGAGTHWLANSLRIKPPLTLSKLLTANDRIVAPRKRIPKTPLMAPIYAWLEFGERFLPRPTTTFTKRRLYLMRWNARPFGCFFFSCLATFGV